MDAILAIDAGTTGITALVVDGSATVIARGYQEFPQYFPADGQVEHDLAEMWAATLAANGTADVGFVHLDVIAAPKVTADPVTALADHASAELVQDLESGFVPAKAKLALELHGGGPSSRLSPWPKRPGRP